jgi:outer membrane immunogenic protein
MRRALILAGACLLLALSASAGAAQGRGDRPAAFAWTGFYAGIQGGYAWGGTDAVFETAPNTPTFVGTQSYDIDGGMAGALIGWNFRTAGSPWVLGFEADINWASLKGRSAEINVGADLGDHWRTKIDRYGTARARVGYAFGASLLYATGGLAYGHVSTDYIDPSNPTGTSNLHLGRTRAGYVVGAGWEHMVAGDWSLRLEYDYINLSDQRLADPTESTRFETDFHVVKGGITYRFGGGAANAPY